MYKECYKALCFMQLYNILLPFRVILNIFPDVLKYKVHVTMQA